MECERIDDEVFDEIILRRATDPELLGHVGRLRLLLREVFTAIGNSSATLAPS